MGKIIERRNPSGATVYGIRYVDEHGNDTKRFSRAWTKQQAKAELDAVENRLTAGVATRVVQTVDDLYHEWLDGHLRVHCGHAHVQDMMRQYRLRIEPMIGHRRVDTVNRAIIKKMVGQMKAVARAEHPDDEFGGNRTINKTVTALKGMFTYAVVDLELILKNPAHGIPDLPEEPTRPIDAWPLDVAHRVARWALDRPDRQKHKGNGKRAEWAGARDYTIIMLAALTGLRQSELFALRWDHVEGHWLHVSQRLCKESMRLGRPKSRRSTRMVPLVPLAREILDAWRSVGAHPEIVFPNHAGTAHARANLFYRDAWDKARHGVGRVSYQRRQYDCTSLTFHELRHTFISLALAAGRDVWEVANWAGDDPEMIKRVYGHYITDSLGDTKRLERTFSIPARRRPPVLLTS